MGRTPTPKQLEFANAIVSGAAPSEAYRQAYRADGMSSASVAREAQRLLSNPVIAPIVEEGRREAAEAAKWSLRKALERLQAVNDRCFEEFRGHGRHRAKGLHGHVGQAKRAIRHQARSGNGHRSAHRVHAVQAPIAQQGRGSAQQKPENDPFPL